MAVIIEVNILNKVHLILKQYVCTKLKQLKT